MGEDKQAAFETLYEALLTVSKLVAPLAPFISEAIYRRLTHTQKHAPQSVHLCELPTARDAAHQFRQEDLEAKMEAVRAIVTAGRSLRSAKSIKIRQPLSRLLVVAENESKRAAVATGSSLIRDELNVKSVELIDSAGELMRHRAEPVFKALGPKFGKRANAVAELIRRLDQQQIRQFQDDGTIELRSNGETITVSGEELRIVEEHADGLAVSTELGWTIALDTELNEDLIAEGLARDFVNRVQNMRKAAGFEVVDRIRIHYQGSDSVERAVRKMQEYIRNETLADELTKVESGTKHLGHQETWNLGTETVMISVERA